jgi:hypothetical protein
MTTEPELLAELVKANKSLVEMNKYLKFTNILQVSVLTFGFLAILFYGLSVLGN